MRYVLEQLELIYYLKYLCNTRTRFYSSVVHLLIPKIRWLKSFSMETHNIFRKKRQLYNKAQYEIKKPLPKVSEMRKSKKNSSVLKILRWPALALKLLAIKIACTTSSIFWIKIIELSFQWKFFVRKDCFKGLLPVDISLL